MLTIAFNEQDDLWLFIHATRYLYSSILLWSHVLDALPYLQGKASNASNEIIEALGLYLKRRTKATRAPSCFIKGIQAIFRNLRLLWSQKIYGSSYRLFVGG